MYIQIFHYFLALIVPSLIGALAFSIAARLRTQIQITTTLILALMTYVTMITGLYYFKDILNMQDFVTYLNCLSFSRKYILLSTGISVFYGVAFGLLRRVFWWIRR